MADEPRPDDTQPSPPPEEPRPPWEQPGGATGGEPESMDPDDIVAALQNAAAQQHESFMSGLEQERLEDESMPGDEESIWEQMEKQANTRKPEPGEHSLSEFERLVRLGYIEQSFEIGGNTIVLRSLSQKEDLECLEKSGTHAPITQGRAYNLYCISRALQTINGQPWFTQISLTTEDNTLDSRFQKLIKLKPTVTTIIIAEYLDMQREVIEKANYARKKS